MATNTPQQLIDTIFENCIAQSHAMAKSMAKEIKRGVKGRNHKVNPSGITMTEGTITFRHLDVDYSMRENAVVTTKTEPQFKYLDSNVTKNGNIVTIETRLPNYAYFVEHGRAPGKQPPIKPIMEWCRLQGLDTERAPWAMAAKIARDGTQGTPYLYLLNRFQNNIHSLARGWVTAFFKAHYKDIAYDGTELPREIHLDL